MAETSDGFISTKETRKLIGVTTATLINWSKEGKIGFIIGPSGVRLYNKKDVHNIIGRNSIPPQKEQICYCRVSTRKQMDDLERQKDFFKEKFPTYTLVTDIGSGLNWKRKGLQTILERAMSGVVEEVVVEAPVVEAVVEAPVAEAVVEEVAVVEEAPAAEDKPAN